MAVVDDLLLGASALGTLVLAGVTWQLANKTRQMAEATKNMATQTKVTAEAAVKEAMATEALTEAAVKEAMATVGLAEEAKSDRELSLSPYLVRLETTGTKAPVHTVHLKNVGRGPAVQVYYYACDPQSVSRWWYVKVPQLASGEILGRLSPRLLK